MLFGDRIKNVPECSSFITTSLMTATHMVASKILLTITDGSSNWSQIKDQFRQEMGQHKYLLKALEVAGHRNREPNRCGVPRGIRKCIGGIYSSVGGRRWDTLVNQSFYIE